jgi:hypothetical protein
MPKIEDEICQKFIEKNILKGNFLVHIPVGIEEIKRQVKKRHAEQLTEKEFRMFEGVLSKRIDLLCITPPIKGLEITEHFFVKRAMKLQSWLNMRLNLKGRKAWILEAKP